MRRFEIIFAVGKKAALGPWLDPRGINDMQIVDVVCVMQQIIETSLMYKKLEKKNWLLTSQSRVLTADKH